MLETTSIIFGYIGLGILILTFVLERVLRIQHKHYWYDVINTFGMSFVGVFFLVATMTAFAETITGTGLLWVLGVLIVFGVYIRWAVGSNMEFQKPVLYFSVAIIGAVTFILLLIFAIISSAGHVDMSELIGVVAVTGALFAYVWWPLEGRGADRNPFGHFILTAASLALLVVYVLMGI